MFLFFILSYFMICFANLRIIFGNGTFFVPKFIKICCIFVASKEKTIKKTGYGII